MFLPKTDRKIIPRWRDFSTTNSLGQLCPASAAGASVPELPPLDSIEALEAWRTSPSLWHALDLVSSAYVLGDSTQEEVVAAAKFIEGNPQHAPAPSLRLVSKILHPEDPKGAASESSHATTGAIHDSIHETRRRLADEPRNSILWTDIAFLYTNLGQMEKARNAIEIAWRLSPENRFVVRSAARFLIHIGDYEKALRVLRAAPTNDSDPWIVAAEIGVSSFVGPESKSIKLGRRMVDDKNFTDFAKSELASALATIELREGNRKAAKKLFKQSLDLPTENSVAQAEWASTLVGELSVPTTGVNTPRNFEAKVIHGFRDGDWNNALTNAQRWLDDQPFSSRPANVVAYLYSSILEEYEEARRVLEFSLVSNAGDRELINNMAFALLNLNRIDEAQELLRNINPKAADDLSTISLTATLGLLNFRLGNPELGRLLYLDAIESAKRKSNPRYMAMAALYLAIEEQASKSATKLESYSRAIELAAKVDEADVNHITRRLKLMASENGAGG